MESQVAASSPPSSSATPKQHVWHLLNRALATVRDVSEHHRVNEHVRPPRIAVVGGQSTGKSSFLQLIARVFGLLPQGTGIVTRCPIELTLENDLSLVQPQMFFDGDDSHVYTDVAQVRTKITNRTQTLAPGDVSDQPVRLTVRSSEVPNLTLIDLPGLIAHSSEDANLPAKIQALVHDYIKDENTLIVCVAAAHSDLANSAGLAAACRADPQFKRTVGILTYADLMNEGCDVANFVLGKETPKLPLGWFLVKNPTPKEMKSRDLTMNKVVTNGFRFFEGNSHYNNPEVLKRCGHDNVVAALQKYMMVEILHKCDKIIGKMEELKTTAQNDLNLLVDGGISMNRLRDYFLMIAMTISGCLHDSEIDHAIRDKLDEAAQLCAGAHIHTLCTQSFRARLTSNADIKTHVLDAHISSALKAAKNSGGDILGPFEKVTKRLAADCIRLLHAPALGAIADLEQCLQQLVTSVCEKVLPASLSNLRQWNLNVLAETIREVCAKLRDATAQLISISCHVEFEDIMEDPRKFLAEHPPVGLKDDVRVQGVRHAVTKIFEETRGSIGHKFIRYVRYFVLGDFKQSLIDHLLNHKFETAVNAGSCSVDFLLSQGPDVQKKKTVLAGLISKYQKAVDDLYELRKEALNNKEFQSAGREAEKPLSTADNESNNHDE